MTQNKRDTIYLGREISQPFVFKLFTIFLIDILHLVFIRFLMWHNEHKYHLFIICAVDISKWNHIVFVK